jgi:subtilisin-like proprotein convertase family protein
MPIHTYVGSGLTVPADRPTQSRASLISRAPGAIKSLAVKVVMRHACATDLAFFLEAPSGTRVLLSRRCGGSISDFVVVFADDADASIVEGGAPISKRYRPMQPLSQLHGQPAAGEWTLVVEDRVAGDGGVLETWSIELETAEAAAPFAIELDFGDGMDSRYQQAFADAAQRWQSVITGPLSKAQLPNGRQVKDVLIFAKVSPIDGPRGVLGQAGPTHIRWASKLPIAGSMEFDEADMNAMARDGSLVSVITHEMGHVLGFGTLWHYANLIQGSGTDNPVFVGARAMAEYATLRRFDRPTPVPIESEGGPGTAEGHWSEKAFNDELMTGWLDSGENPLSRLTIASLADLGYVVDFTAADSLSALSFRAGNRSKRCHKVIRPPLEQVFT